MDDCAKNFSARSAQMDGCTEILSLIGRKWVLLAQKGQQNGQLSQKGEQNDISLKNVNKIIRIFIGKVKKLSNQLKKVNKIFRFSKELSALAWEGVRRSGWKFPILVLWWPEKKIGAITIAPKFRRNGSVDASGTMDGFFPVGPRWASNQLFPLSRMFRYSLY